MEIFLYKTQKCPINNTQPLDFHDFLPPKKSRFSGSARRATSRGRSRAACVRHKSAELFISTGDARRLLYRRLSDDLDRYRGVRAKLRATFKYPAGRT